MPRDVDFPGLGRLVVRECRPLGWPGKAFLRVQFSYVNTTGHTVGTPRVTLTVLDETGERWSRTSLDLVVPFATEMTSNSTYSSWLDVRTEGIHREEGWDWRLELALAGDTPETDVRPAD